MLSLSQFVVESEAIHYSIVCVHKKISTVIEQVDFVTDCEIEWCKIQVQGSKQLYVGSFYMPHRSMTDLRKLDESLSKLQERNDKHIMLCGDFNCPDIDWETLSVPLSSTERLIPERDVQQRLVDISIDHGLTQVHQEPTREGNILDLVFTNNPSLIKASVSVLGIADHDMVITDSHIKPCRAYKAPRKCYRFKQANWEEIRDEMATLSQTLTDLHAQGRQVEELWKVYKKTIFEVLDKHVPSKICSAKRSLPWLCPKLKKLIKRKSKLHQRAKRSGSWEDYRVFQRHCRKQFRQAEWDHINNVIIEGLQSNNTKPFWNYVKSKRQDNIGVAPLKSDGQLISDNKGISDVLVKQFQSVFTKDRNLFRPPVKHPNIIETLQNIKIRVPGVRKLLHDVKVAKAVGPDGIPNLVLKECADQLAPGLTLIFQESINTGVLPEDWLNANVAPLFKKGDRHKAENYRPVSLTSVTGKLLEHIICRELLNHLERYNILTSLNHGFRAGFSCETQLILTLHDLLQAYDKGEQMDVCILDFSKAFDTVPHDKLLYKLGEYGVRGPVHKWLTSFLTKRHMRVVVEGEHSKSVTVDSGVPQGTVLGPVLFLCHINDLPECVKSQVRLFADDCLLYRKINSQEDHNILQNDLAAADKWATDWGMRFNAKKCYVMSIRPKSTHFYQLSNEILKQVAQNPYLGVQIANDLKWANHIQNISGKASSTLGLLKRNLKHCPEISKRLAYISLVRSTLEYGATIWDPYYVKDIIQLERIQRRAVRFIISDYLTKTEGFITNKLQDLNLETLQERRKQLRLVLFYKVVNGHVPAINPEDYLTKVTGRRRAKPSIYKDCVVLKQFDRSVRKHNNCYQTTAGRTEQFRNSFFIRTVVDWNNLDETSISAETINKFKSALRLD